MRGIKISRRVEGEWGFFSGPFSPFFWLGDRGRNRCDNTDDSNSVCRESSSSKLEQNSKGRGGKLGSDICHICGVSSFSRVKCYCRTCNSTSGLCFFLLPSSKSQNSLGDLWLSQWCCMLNTTSLPLRSNLRPSAGHPDLVTPIMASTSNTRKNQISILGSSPSETRSWPPSGNVWLERPAFDARFPHHPHARLALYSCSS